MNNNLVRVAVVLDRSGSMNSLREAIVNGINEFVGSLRAQPGEVNLKLVQFDSESYDVVFDRPLKDVPEMTEAMFIPRGMTPLLDAQAKTIVILGEELAKIPESDRPGKVIVMTMTDGLENASKEYEAPQVAAMVGEQREKYGWEFMYLGANQDSFAQAAAMGIPRGSTMNYAGAQGAAYAPGAAGIQLNSMRDQMRSGVPSRSLQTSFTDDDRKKAMGDKAPRR